MFEFYRDCSFIGQNTSSWFTLILQLATPLIALCAVIIALRNLAGLTRAQSIQTHMNLIALENEIRKNHATFKISALNHKNATKSTSEKILTSLQLDTLKLEEDNAFIAYVNSVDKLASLINAKYVQEQFNERDWKNEYEEIFKDVKNLSDGYFIIITNKSSLITNIDKVLLNFNFTKK